MLITPIPGVNHNALRTALIELRSWLGRVHGSAGATERAYQYLEWVQEARRRLRTQICPADLESLLPTKEYELVLAAIASRAAQSLASPGGVHSEALAGERLLNGLVSMQMDERLADLDAAVTGLDQQVQRFQRDAELVVLDTNVYIHHAQKLEDMDLSGELHLGFANIHIIVPLVVIDELDKSKRSGGDRGYRAAYSVSYIDRIVRAGGRIRAADLSNEEKPRGEVTVEVMLDPPGHVRLPINDDEIVARAVSIQTLAGRPIRLVTNDTKMSMRARDAGLRVHRLEEPEKKDSKQAKVK